MTELGEIPAEWQIKRLIDVVDMSDRYSFTGGPFGSNLKSCDYTNDGVRVVQLQNMGDGKFIDQYFIYTSKEKADELISCNIYPGDIIVAKMAEPVARACKIPDYENRYLMCSDGIRVVVDKNRFDVDFIIYSINSKYFRNNAIANSTGTTRLRIGLNELRNLPVIIPSYLEQQKIALILSSIDDQIENTDNLIEKTKELKKGLMNKLLTKGIGHNRFKDTEIGRIPEDWEVKKLDELVEFFNGKPHENEVCDDGDYILVNSKFISSDGNVVKYSNNCLFPLQKNDIVMVMSDVPNGKAISKVFLIPEDCKYTLNQRICCLRTNKMDNKFLSLIVNRNNYYLKFDDGVKQTNLRKDEVLGLSVQVPPISEQKSIVNIICSIEEQICYYELENKKYKEIKKGLMQKLLTGQIRVKI